MDHNPQKSSIKWTMQIVHQTVHDPSSWPDSSQKPFNMESRIFFMTRKANIHQFLLRFLGLIQHRPKVPYKLLSFEELVRACKSPELELLQRISLYSSLQHEISLIKCLSLAYIRPLDHSTSRIFIP